jgi:hypothetical protein
LIGAHTIGHVSPDNSGYGFIEDSNSTSVLLNAWNPTPAVFDNKYYQTLLENVITFLFKFYFSDNSLYFYIEYKKKIKKK